MILVLILNDKFDHIHRHFTTFSLKVRSQQCSIYNKHELQLPAAFLISLKSGGF